MKQPLAGTTPGNRGRFGGYDVLGEAPRWDLRTAAVVLARLSPAPTLSFFDAAEEPTARALLDLLVGQHEEPKVPVTELVDARLAAGETDGWRYDDMPEDGEAWKRSIAALNEQAREHYGAVFHKLRREEQAALVQEVQDADTWRSFDAAHLWSLWTRYACAAFYSHPWAWNEIGFGGPAYPRGYKNLGLGRKEPWEKADRRPEDPIPWSKRVERAKREHASRLVGSVPGEGASQQVRPESEGLTAHSGHEGE